ncbi:MAG: tetratricopeptide repeat protein [Planctomycetota bacterium]
MSDSIDEIAELFEAVRALPAAERTAFLVEHCSGRAALRREIESLLEHEDDRFLETPARGLELLAERDVTPETIGPYTLLEHLGEGGFGVVWRAEQREPIQRVVALKLVRSGVASAAAIARFEAERQALALLDDPGIARIHEAGTTPDGRPWFAMELVEGEPITAHCTRARMGLADRIRLVEAVCRAVHHAHERGIVHRDLKPSNVLVRDDAGRPRPKVIDFGVAKALESPLSERLARTEAGAIIGTPAYMSPEQARGDVDAVDARTDVHALGVVLFELVTGTLPFEPDRDGTPDAVELHRRIRDDDAPRPSSRIVERLETPGYRSPVLARAVRGDLDWIVLRALEKEPARRYASAAELADDLARFLADRPVTASPPSRWYRLRKLVRRHRVASAALVIAVVSLAAGARIAIDSLGRAAESKAVALTEAEKLQGVSDFLRAMLASANPDRGLGADVTVRQILDDAARELDVQKLAPEIETQLRLTLGTSYLAVGNPAGAEMQLQRALTLADLLGSRECSEIRSSLGMVWSRTGRITEARGVIEKALTLAAGPRDRIDALGALATLDLLEARLDEAERHLREAIRIADSTAGMETVQTINRIQLGDVLERSNRFAEAEAELAEARRRAEAEGPTGRLRVLRADRLLATLLLRNGEAKRAEEVARRNVDLAIAIHGEDHPDCALVLGELAEILQERDKTGESEQLFRRAIATMHRVVPGGSPAEAQTLGNLGWLLHRLQKDDEARECLQRSLDMRRALFGDRHPDVASVTSDLAILQRDEHHYDEALKLGREALAIYEESLGAHHLNTAIARHSLGVTLSDAGRNEEAVPVLDAALTDLRALLPEEHWQVAEFRKRLARALLAIGRSAEAKQQIETAYGAMVRAQGNAHRRAQSLVKTMIDIGIELRDWTLCEQWRSKLVEADRDYALDVERAYRNSGK